MLSEPIVIRPYLEFLSEGESVVRLESLTYGRNQINQVQCRMRCGMALAPPSEAVGLLP